MKNMKLVKTMVKRQNRKISLAEADRRRGHLPDRGTSRALGDEASPTLKDLTEVLHFALGDGRIWLNDQRMVLMQSLVLGRLRAEIIDAFGLETAKAIFMRVGYMQGVRDAELISKRFPQNDLTHALAAGPRVHTLEGFVKVTTKHFEFDRTKGTYHGEFYWDDSSEAAEHVASYGLASEPVCWMQTGYPSGYTSKLFGRPVIFRETECAGMGAPRCVVVGQNAEAWGKDVPEREYLGLEWRARRASPGSSRSPSRAQHPAPPADGGVAVGVSAGFLRTRLMMEKVAPTDATVLFIGESGVGKELFSSQLHDMSLRRSGPFIAINCAAIPENLVESELFGVEKGAFTGAVASRPGYFERASGGTLFLDEIASLAYSAQGKLLRALQERKIERVGGGRTISVDVRIAAASNVDLTEEIRAGRFRQDLYFRLSVFPILIPPLRERRDDIPLLMAYFLQSFNVKHKRNVLGFTRSATDALLGYDFPGNIRELQNLVERGVIFADDNREVDLHHLFTGKERLSAASGLTGEGRIALLGDAKAPVPLTHFHAPGSDVAALRQAERDLYQRALADAGGNVSAAARALGLSRAKVEYRLKKSS
jgi:DNA-binding NtrC family response regulator